MDGSQSIWQPCPLMYRILNRVLELVPTGRVLDMNCSGILPFFNQRNKEKFRLSLKSQLLDPNINDHPDIRYGEAILQDVSSLVLEVLDQRNSNMCIQVLSVKCLSRTDRQFLHVLLHKDQGNDRIVFECKKGYPDKRRQQMSTHIKLLQKGKKNRLLGIILHGIDRALRCALYDEALLRIRLALRLFHQIGEAPTELIERLSMVYMAKGDNKRAVDYLRLMVAQVKAGLSQCYALISLAAQLISLEESPENFSQAKECLARVKKLESDVVGDERWLVGSMRLNTAALLFFKAKNEHEALESLVQSYRQLEQQGLLHKFASQAAILCDNAIRVALHVDEHEALVWAERILRLELHEPHLFMRCSKALLKLKKWEEALQFADLAVEYGYPVGQVGVHRALCFYNLGEYDKALLEVEKAEKYTQRNAQTCLMRAVVLEELQDFEAAQLNYEWALERDSENGSVWADYARVLWLKGEPIRSREALTTAIKLDPHRAELQDLMRTIFPMERIGEAAHD